MSESVSERLAMGVRLVLPDVIRIRDAHGSSIEPPLNEMWTDAEKIAWQAAVVAADSGLEIGVTQFGNLFSISLPGMCLSSVTYTSAWTLLNGISHGAEAVKRATS